MQVIFGRRLAFKEKLNSKGSTPSKEFKVELPDPFILVFNA
jgi:hypothetical protein